MIIQAKTLKQLFTRSAAIKVNKKKKAFLQFNCGYMTLMDIECNGKVSTPIEAPHESYTLRVTPELKRFVSKLNNTDSIQFDEKGVISQLGASFSADITTDYLHRAGLVYTDSFKYSVKCIKPILDTVIEHCAIQDVRYYLCGALFEVTNTDSIICATDGHRLYKNNQRIDNESGRTLRSIIPLSALQMLKKCIVGNKSRTVSVQFNESAEFGRFIFEDQTIVEFKSIDGRFPEYQRVIPERQTPVKIDKQQCKAIIKQANISGNQKYFGVKLEAVEGSSYIEASTSTGTVVGKIETDHTFKKHWELGVNSQYLIDAIDGIRSDNLVLNISSSTATFVSLLVEGDNHRNNELCVVMPMRL